MNAKKNESLLSLKIEKMIKLVGEDAILDKCVEEFCELGQAISKYNYFKKVFPEKTQFLDNQKKEVFNELCDVYLMIKYLRKIFNFNSNNYVSEKQMQKIDRALKGLNNNDQPPINFV